MNSDSIAKRIEGLPEESRKTLLTLLDLLASKAENSPSSSKPHAFKFDWEGGLSGAFDGLTSVDLQHEASKWR